MTKKQNRPVTMVEVAKAAGVSQTTVSLIINNVTSANISEATRQRVWDTIRELGYRPNAAARKMRTNRSHFIGFITDEIATTPHAGLMVKGAQDEAWNNHKIILLVNTNANMEMEVDAVEVMLEHQVEGIIYAAMYHRCVQPPKPLYEVPTVLLNCFTEKRDLPSIASDEVQGGFTATEYLIQKGRRRIAFANFIGPTPGSVGRLEGYQKALRQYGIPHDPSLVCHGSGEADGGYDCTMKLFKTATPPDGLFCFNDRMAMGAYDALRKLNLSIPEEVAVVGFDNQVIISEHLYPGLTTLQLPHYDMGRWAVQYLLSIIEKPESKTNIQSLMPCPLVIRESA